MNLIFFGAGASYGSDYARNAKLPPLGKYLFKALKKYSSAWKKIDNEYHQLFEQNFELGMFELIKNNKDDIFLQKDLAKFFFQFSPRKVNLYNKLARKIASANSWNGAFITLNYERLLELSLIQNSILPQINHDKMQYFYKNSLINYNPEKLAELYSIKKGKHVEICYPHGACHIVAKNTFFGDIKGVRVSFNGGGIIHGAFYLHNEDSFNQIMSKPACIPLMTYYEQNKRHPLMRSEGSRQIFEFLVSQENRFKELILNSNKIIIVGVMCNSFDEHIWQPMAESNAEIIYFEPNNSKPFTDWAEKNNKKYTVINKTFEDGFKELCQYADLN